MVDITDAEIDAALERGRQIAATEPHAASARFDRELRRIVIELTNGATFSFPPHVAQGLEAATDEELAGVELWGDGYALHWETLDIDYTVPGLLAGRFGTAAWMEKQSKQAKSPARATRRNGTSGKRPHKTAQG
jgi:hypothetical protein